MLVITGTYFYRYLNFRKDTRQNVENAMESRLMDFLMAHLDFCFQKLMWNKAPGPVGFQLRYVDIEIMSFINELWNVNDLLWECMRSTFQWDHVAKKKI